MKILRCNLLCLALACSLAPVGRAADFHPDPASVQWYGPAYRYSQNGWIVLHIEGQPYERGIQHGRLLAPEIAGYVRCLAASYGPKDPAGTWEHIRSIAGVFMLPRFSQEMLEEMKGIADGASAAGARFDHRELDVVDIVAINCSDEIDSLPESLEATPTGVDDLELPVQKKSETETDTKPEAFLKRLRPRPKPCDAFAAMGSATKDGKIVVGHITMFDLYQGNFYNVWLDLTPAQGQHFAMQTTPAGMHSGMNYTINDAGIMMAETMTDQGAFDSTGVPQAARIREATQYADTIEKAADMLMKNSNGLATTEWVFADIKRNEIGLLTLGAHQHKLRLSSRKEWVAGAEDFYWSCNNNKDLNVRLEGLPSLNGAPSTLGSMEPSKRDSLWLRMYDTHKGKIDADFGRLVLTTPAMVSSYSVDAKYTTADMAGQFETWAMFGPSVGVIRRPDFTEQTNFPEIQPLVSNPWTVIHATPPPHPAEGAKLAADLYDPENPEDEEIEPFAKKTHEPITHPVWHGTLIPKTDADIWFTTAFANYEEIVSDANARQEEVDPDDEEAVAKALDALAVDLFYHRSDFELGRRSGRDFPLSKTVLDWRDENWYSVATGKGVLLLHSLRGMVGEEKFDQVMDEFGRAHAGKEVSVAEFQAYLEKQTGQSWAAFMDAWTNQLGLPRLALGDCEVHQDRDSWTTKVTVSRDKTSGGLVVPVTVETEEGDEETAIARLDEPEAVVEINTDERPIRVIVDKYGVTARGNGQPFTILAWENQLEDALIVYGSGDDEAANHEAAQTLQQSLRRREHNIAPPIKSDADVTDDDLKNHHVLLIGRPDTNRLVARFREILPVKFGQNSFTVRGETYAHPESGVVMAVENPLNRRYSLTVIAANSSLGTMQVVPDFEDETYSYAQVVVLPHNGEERDFVLPAPELVRELPQK